MPVTVDRSAIDTEILPFTIEVSQGPPRGHACTHRSHSPDKETVNDQVAGPDSRHDPGPRPTAWRSATGGWCPAGPA